MQYTNYRQFQNYFHVININSVECYISASIK